jgi:curved DNA-binding protein
MDYKDYYKVMGVERGANADEIKRSYRKLARKYHPDVSKEKNAEEKFKEVQEAYEVLKDPEKRSAYDQLGSQWREGQNFRPPPDWGKGHEFSHSFGGAEADPGFSDFFASLFGGHAGFARQGGGRGFAAPGQDHAAKIEISLEDSFRGGSQDIELKTQEMTSDGHVIVKPRTFRVAIPAGVMEGQQIRLAGQGGAGAGGGRAGNLYLEVAFRPHPLYTVDGRNLTLTLPIAPWEAVLGETVPVPTLGGAVDMRIPAGAKSGQRMRLKGRGLPGSPPGDQFIVLKIVLPPTDTPEARAFFEKMKRELPFDPRAELQQTRADDSA